MMARLLLLITGISLAAAAVSAQHTFDTLGHGWSRTSVNTVVFRKNSIVTEGNRQYAAYYDANGFIVLAHRERGSSWKQVETSMKGNVADAHNSISIGVDGDGYLHIAWDHHNNELHYARSASPGSFQIIPMASMTGKHEREISYPEFHRLPSGDLLFFYRSGESGQGNLIMNRYDLHTKQWRQIQHNLIDGEGERNAYWQSYVDGHGVIHLSWVWRETWDVSTNHDLCYARSRDGGASWEKISGEKYMLPIAEKTAGYALRIPQNSELINQTSMSVDDTGTPYIASYWRQSDSQAPQYFLVWHDGKQWTTLQVSNRKTDFTLRGGGTKKIPMSRPQIVADKSGKRVFMIFRDSERQSRVSIAEIDLQTKKWFYTDLTTDSVGDWEPTYDIERWKKESLLDIFVQRTGQGDGEKEVNLVPQPVVILGYRPQ